MGRAANVVALLVAVVFLFGFSCGGGGPEQGTDPPEPVGEYKPNKPGKPKYTVSGSSR